WASCVVHPQRARKDLKRWIIARYNRVHGDPITMKRSIPRGFASLCVAVVAFLFATMLLLFSTGAQAQSAAATGRLEGTVTDPSGAAVPEAEVTVRNQNTGAVTTVRSS